MQENNTLTDRQLAFMRRMKLTLIKQPNRLTHMQQLLKFLLDGKTITGLSAMRQMHIYRLSARIHDLRAMGFLINTDRDPTNNAGRYTMSNDYRKALREIFNAM